MKLEPVMKYNMNKSKIRIFTNNFDNQNKFFIKPFVWTIGYFFNSCDELAELIFIANKDEIYYKIEYI